MDYVFPIIHSNGSGRDSLFEAALEAHSAIGRACAALQEMAPNGRDYGGNAFETARAQFLVHLKALEDAQKYVLEYGMHVGE